ncbi:MAG TPA: CheR family methyltransferase [Chloroflexia bacterium]|nr:CheR family methyltransferase [Chloroflexia bacterium]
MNNANPSWPEFTPADFERFRQLLLEKSGLLFDQNRQPVMQTVIQERMHVYGLREYSAYYRLLEATTQSLDQSAQNGMSRELRRLVESLVINETAFFRNREHFRVLSETVLPDLIQRKIATKKLRFWSAGCSTGQEPYSLAIATLEALQKAGQIPSAWQIEVVGSDISDRALRIAQHGRYRNEEMRGLNPDQIRHYFRPLTSDAVLTAPLDPNEIYRPGFSPLPRPRQRATNELVPEIRQMVDFFFFNLATSVYPADKLNNFDLVLCENVTIYFSPEITRKVVENIYKTINEGGYFFIGYSETLWQVSDRFKLINMPETFYYQKPFAGELDKLRSSRPRTTNNLGKHHPTTKLRERDAVKPLQWPGNPQQPTTSNLWPVNPRSRSGLTGKLQKSRSGEAGMAGDEKGLSDQLDNMNWQELLAQGQKLVAEYRFEKASSYLEKALSKAPEEVEALCALADLKLKMSEYSTAAELCRKAISLDRLAEPAHLMLAMINHKEGHLDEAIQEFKHTIYINPRAVVAYIRLADIYRTNGYPKEALREYRQALVALKQHSPDELVEGVPVRLLIQACEQNIARLTQLR